MGGPTMGSPSGPPPPSAYPGGTRPESGDPAAGNLPNAGTTSAPLGPTSQGAVGMRGLSLTTSGPAAVISSSTQKVHLDSGTQLILRTQ